MNYIIPSAVILIIVFYFLKKSKNNVFSQDELTLNVLENDMYSLLVMKGRTKAEINHYMNAFAFFRKFTTKFDGATIVKDLCDLPKLDLDAMVHDYECLIGANRNFIKWFKSAWNYFENMRKNGKGNQIFRFVLVSLVGLIFVPYCALFTPRYSPINKKATL